MSSLSTEDYKKMRTFIIKIKKKLMQECGITAVESPILDIASPKKFDGNRAAIQTNFKKLKQVDSLLVIYPKAICSSVLVEVGYALSLGKKTVVFYNDALPYILKDAGQEIKHISTKKYQTFEDIELEICSNAKALFKVDDEEE